MANNAVIKGRDGVIPIIVSGVDLTAFNYVKAIFGSDERRSDIDPRSVDIIDATTLYLRFGDTLETEGHEWQIYGYDALNVNGVPITSSCSDNPLISGIC